MADSGQQPTASAEVDTLVNEIFEMLMDMEIKRIDHRDSSDKLCFDTILRDLPSFSPEVRAERLYSRDEGTDRWESQDCCWMVYCETDYHSTQPRK